ncbi:TIGR04283 family arsenosugar biosynthesis glycosyltransferase [Cognataquiflexum rubidum]|uniref:TIGR04283 family arsenosugar biosynthesis glycosyltransferase n=1 Tax=Cognataquiflexum rubidum TaxID=2922273 RepID=UPI001F13459C|nr:TIGR04283 family arsenosugar biosynthesis glycosyltransferase [Cognataquiflexum rubidum]MCH6233483.1 TIGR04283 family arsenosugar biosynthesis glycosyltransferase [Cognataquiflexum rubidum]
MKISIIIPVLNEAENLKELLPFFRKVKNREQQEVIVADGGSTDGTKEVVEKAGFRFLTCGIQSRAAQMNMGAKESNGDIFYFVHADVRILPSFYEDIMLSLNEGFQTGCFAYNFYSNKKMLRINSWFTQFNGLFSGGGDQTLFIRKDVFLELGGFDEKFCLMEDFELVRRIKKKYGFKVIPKRILVSARKYENNSWLRVQIANMIVFGLFFLHHPPTKLKTLYSRLLK